MKRAIEPKLTSRYSRAWLGLALVACLQSGSAMCSNDFDYFYPAYGGSVAREDMVRGRVNSISQGMIARPSVTHQGGAYMDDSHQPLGSAEGEEGFVPFPNDGTGIPYDSTGDAQDIYLIPEEGASRQFEYDGPVKILPESRVESMSYQDDWSDQDSWDEEPAAHDGGEEGGEEIAFEPDYGYDDVAYDRKPRDDASYDDDVSSPSGPTPPWEFGQAPIGSGVATTRSASPAPRSLPRHDTPMPTPTVDEALLNALIPVTSAPRLEPTP